ncbi:FtsW/RodA/SpoVE family cell cycle protein [Streptomyces antarcticus]|uniref:FtsW/RodA/SpoVE family cell cycle protein n=1 Tax=Streptomyces antarcticus TaxID=2996458 RepID=UPI00226E3E66|nr:MULTISPECIES: FtsW/RodA/SpoVE family cell cycle protein [unclassified Streptomyces]MCY0941640.1 FtsW/RodA/SpoVE family cell cycle protein [Streptomyces sp. H34-AA3]MCZ4081733.1 FtsW/RodA/SpoVE family cell cycle protein [Streptomyces sp. H34-S5]
MRGLKSLTTAGARRRTEALLLVFVVVIAVLGHACAGLAMNDGLPPNLAGFTVSMTLLSLVGHLGVRRFAAYADPLVFPLAMLLTGLGLVLLHRLDQGYIERYGADANAPGQLMWTVVGVAACLVVLALLRDHRLLQRFIYLTMAVALVLLIAPAFFGADTYGAKRWIILFGFSLQPGEFVKIMIAVFFAGYLVIHRDSLALSGRKVLGVRLPPMRQLGPIVTVWIVSMLVLVFERDLGTSLIFFGVFVVMLYVATERTGWIVCGLVMASLGAFAVGSTEPHVKARVAAWLEPLSYYWENRPAGVTSDQSAQALFSFGTGGISGTGLGLGHPELIKFAGRSDFILTTVGEELGLAGVMAVLLLYALLVQRGLRMALGARDPFGKLLAVGLASALALQVFVVAGGVTGLIPLTGKALPFLAKGGSSLLANWVMIALLLRISDSAERQREADSLGPAETTITPVVVAAGAGAGSGSGAGSGAGPGTGTGTGTG